MGDWKNQLQIQVQVQKKKNHGLHRLTRIFSLSVQIWVICG